MFFEVFLQIAIDSKFTFHSRCSKNTKTGSSFRSVPISGFPNQLQNLNKYFTMRYPVDKYSGKVHAPRT